MVLYVIGRIVIQLFEHPIVHKDGAIGLISGILGLFALIDAVNCVVKVLDRPIALVLLIELGFMPRLLLSLLHALSRSLLTHLLSGNVISFFTSLFFV